MPLDHNNIDRNIPEPVPNAAENTIIPTILRALSLSVGSEYTPPTYPRTPLTMLIKNIRASTIDVSVNKSFRECNCRNGTICYYVNFRIHWHHLSLLFVTFFRFFLSFSDINKIPYNSAEQC